MGAWMGMSDVLVSPRSEGDNTPLKLYTYMSSGSPIVATRRRTHTQVLDDSMAFLAELDPFSFARAISVALFNSTIAKNKASKAKAIVEEKYNYKTFSEKLFLAYNATNS
jgi:glycosyltransferase involved in cell wall biosynthesis